MKTLIKSLLTVATLSATALLSSCQAPSSAPTSAVSCSKCGTVYFKAPATGGVGAAGAKGGFITLKPAGRMDCADCENKVAGWVKFGTLTEHTCKTCGGTLNHCTRH